VVPELPNSIVMLPATVMVARLVWGRWRRRARRYELYDERGTVRLCETDGVVAICHAWTMRSQRRQWNVDRGALFGYESVTTADDGADGGPNPTLFFAMTVQVYVLAALRCVTRIGEAPASFERVTPPSDDTHAAR